MYAQLLKHHQFYFNPITFIISFHVLLINTPVCRAQINYEQYYSDCSNTTRVTCGDMTFIPEYPFWGKGIRFPHCGLDGFELHCENNHLFVDIGTGSKYYVHGIILQRHVLILNRSDDPLGSICASGEPSSTVLNETLYYYGDNTQDLNLVYNCDDEINSTWVSHTFTCPRSDREKRVYFFLGNLFDLVPEKPDFCNNTTIQVDKAAFEDLKSNRIQPETLLNMSFEVQYKGINEKACLDCKATGGLCWRGTYTDGLCLYSNGTVHPPYGRSGEENKQDTNPPGKQTNMGLKIAIYTSVVVGCSILLLMVLITICRRMKTKNGASLFYKDAPSYPKDIEAFIKQYGSSIPTRFKYSTLKKITDSFKAEIGKGGYGNVYRGCLADGRVVAVKVLKEAKGNGEEFINEVASIGRTSHVNVVTLLGFCYEGKRRALVYEFMPNGSLEKFIYGTTPSLEGHLGWEKLYSIAIGIARGLEYLHRGCNTRILHFDIKPHNILLDENFRPRISDFGLAKLHTTEESIMTSLLQARGTIGYIAPEVTSRNFGPVSHKSDVYSYGMMILEMVGGRKNVDAGADHTSEIYYPRWLYKRIQFDDALNMADEISTEENELVRKMVIVGLWCIQIYPSQRPSISKVIEMLEGQTAALEIPPRPYLCSVPGSPSNSEKNIVFCSVSGTEHTSSA